MYLKHIILSLVVLATAVGDQRPNTMHLATRVPLIAKVPGKKPVASSSLVETTTIFPSLCALAGIAAPATVHGRDFSTLLDTPAKALPRDRLQPVRFRRRRRHRSFQPHQL